MSNKKENEVLVLKKPIIFPAGTIFHNISGRTSTVGEDVYAHTFGLQPDSSGEIAYRMDKGDEKFFEPFEKVNLNPASLIKREAENFKQILREAFEHFHKRTGAYITEIRIMKSVKNDRLQIAGLLDVAYGIPEEEDEEIQSNTNMASD